MDALTKEKKNKPVAKGNGYATLRVKKETRKRLVNELKKINEKEFGKKVRMDDYVAFALELVRPEHREHLQNASLTHQDRLNRDYKAYIGQNGAISKDEYLGKRLNGELASTQHTQNEGASETSSPRQ